MKRAFLFGIILSALIGSMSGATVFKVPADRPSIQQAITDANDGDTVLVSPGVYYETINFLGKDIIVTSTDPNDRGIVGYTIINADGDGSVVTFQGGETSKAVLAGFTITGGVGTVAYQYGSSTYRYMQVNGAGIFCDYNASPTITRCVITRNHAPYYQRDDGMMYEYAYSYGGGIYCDGYRAVITHCIIYNNSAYDGGGIYAGNSATVSNNVIYNNSAANGGGVYAYYCSLVNNTIVNNDVSKEPEYGVGGNVYMYFDYGSRGAMVNNVICGAKSGCGIYHRQAHDDVIRFNNVWDNSPANYVSDDQRTNERITGGKADWSGRLGNISENPKFRNASMNDFHLQLESPCVSEGDPNSGRYLPAEDIDGDSRVYALRVDIGADEFVGYVKPLANAGADQHKLTPETITLDAGDSYFSDPESPKTYEWKQVQGTPVELSDVTAQEPSFTPTAEGWYAFQLVVNDGQYTSKPDRVLVVIGNQVPVADAGPDALWPVNEFGLLDGSKSSDADPPDELVYTWRQIDGPLAQFYPFTPQEREDYGIDPATTYVSCPQPGIYVFELVVSDGFTTSAADTVTIEATQFSVKQTPMDIAPPDSEYFQYPVVSGNKLVWAAGDYYDSSWGIRCTDLETGRVDVFQSQPTDTMPEIDGDLIVWATGPEGYYVPIRTSVVIGDLATGKIHNLRMQSGTDSYGYPAISGTKAVWVRHRNVNTGDMAQYAQAAYDICGADVADPAKPVYFTVAEQVGHGLPYPYQNIRESYESPVDISGNLVVWEADGDIYGADISDLQHIKIFPICTASETQLDPAISGHLVVWTDQRDDIGDIYGADISDPNHIREFAVIVSPGPQTQPDIDGRMVAFVASESTGTIELYYLSRQYGPVRVSFPNWRYGGRPRLDDSTLIWQDYSQVLGLTFDFGYGLAEGPIQNLTSGMKYEGIQHAIDTAADGDTLVVQPGVYEEKIRFKGKKVIVRSTEPNDPVIRAGTVIAGTGGQVTFADEESSESVFTGFTVSGGSYGVFCGGSAPAVDRCTITGASSAGVKVWNKGAPVVTRSEIVGNANGVELWAHRDKRVVLNNFGTFHNCLIAGNREAGFYSGYPTLENCTVADNLGLGVDAILAKITNSILYFNNEAAGGPNLMVEKATSAVTYSDVQGGWAGDGNIDADPLFVARGQWAPTGDVMVDAGSRASAVVPGPPDWAAGDYHLKSRGWSWSGRQWAWAWDDATSPCIDAGDPASPIGDEPPCAAGDPLSDRAGANTRIDMGAYGGTAETSLAPKTDTPQP